MDGSWKKKKYIQYREIRTIMNTFLSKLTYFYAKYDLSTFHLYPFSASFSCGVCYVLVRFLIKGSLTFYYISFFPYCQFK